jgi:hypothetical protein
LISRGTLPAEALVVSPLGAVSPTSRTPALLVVGDVVSVREALALRASAA